MRVRVVHRLGRAPGILLMVGLTRGIGSGSRWKSFGVFVPSFWK